jgi:hypothetical protein
MSQAQKMSVALETFYFKFKKNGFKNINHIIEMDFKRQSQILIF